MKATFVPHDPSELSIFTGPVTGNVLCVNVTGTMRRVVLLVSDEDEAKADSLALKSTLVTDLMTGIVHRIKSADCGAGCHCALEFEAGETW